MTKGRKRILVYPCGTEIALEIYKAVEFSTRFELWGGSSNYDHGRYVYKKHIDNLPFISDNSNKETILEFQNRIKDYGIDYIYPAMDGVLYKLSQYASLFYCKIIAPDFNTARITRSKKLTYQLLESDISVPKIYENISEIKEYPVFVKPDIGQGSYGAQKIDNESILQNMNLEDILLMEYLPDEEYTVDCFTNNSGDLIYISPRYRKRIKNGISVSSAAASGHEFEEIALTINEKLDQRGGWFFQVKKNTAGKLVLLEVASRIAGTSAYTRSKGVNLPLLTLYLYTGEHIDRVYENNYDVVIDRALHNSYATDLYYDTVYIDYDDTIIFNGKINSKIITFVYQCINNNIPVIIITKHIGDLNEDLQKYRLSDLFDKIIHIKQTENKYEYITGKNSIFIDDSFGEREIVHKKCNVPVFDTNMIEFLLNPLELSKT
ncbi:carbamoylphosphate synthase large subunit short form [Spirochaetia bacterium]|nr:carbamoylphosphate synthase large subunit short form [Spirochaetia bacterium]